MNLYNRLQLWLALRRLTYLKDEAEFHRTLGISLADQAFQLERQIVIARLEFRR